MYYSIINTSFQRVTYVSLAMSLNLLQYKSIVCSKTYFWRRLGDYSVTLKTIILFSCSSGYRCRRRTLQAPEARLRHVAEEAAGFFQRTAGPHLEGQRSLLGVRSTRKKAGLQRTHLRWHRTKVISLLTLSFQVTGLVTVTQSLTGWGYITARVHLIPSSKNSFEFFLTKPLKDACKWIGTYNFGL